MDELYEKAIAYTSELIDLDDKSPEMAASIAELLQVLTHWYG